MADQSENILLNIQFNEGDINKSIEAIALARQNIDKLIASNKALEAQGEKNSVAYIKNQESIKALNAEVTTNSKVIQANTQAVNQNATSIDALKKRNSELLKERNKIDVSTEEGRKKIEKLNDEYDKNSKVISDNSTKVEKQRFNIGNYQSALDNVSPSLGKFSSNLGTAANASGGLTSGIFSMIKASLAFIATPIGAVIAGLVVAFKALSIFINNSSTGADAFEDIMSSISTVVDVVVDRITALVGGIGKLLSGDFTGGLEDIENSFKGIGDEMEREIRLTVELNAAVRDLEDAEIRHAVAASETENQIKKLLLQSKNRTLSEKERIKLLDQAVELEKRINDEEITNKKKALDIANGFAAKRLDLVKEASETEIEFGKRVLEAFMADGAVQADDLRDNVQKAIVDLNSAEGSSIAILEKIQNQRDALADKADADAQKRREKRLKDAEDAAKKEADAIKKADDERKKAEDDAEKARQDRIKELADQNAKDAQIVKDAYDEALAVHNEYVQGLINNKKRELLEGVINQQEYNQEIADLQIAADETLLAIKEDFGEKDLAVEGKVLDAKIQLKAKDEETTKMTEQAKLDAIQNTIGNVAALFNKNSIAFKALASAQVAIQTYQSAQAVFTGMTETIPGPVGVALGVAGAAAAILAGLQNLAKVNSIKLPKLASGGMIDIGGKRHSQGGEVVTVGGQAVAEVEAGEKMVVLKRGAPDSLLRNLSSINQMIGGRDFYSDRSPRYRNADGGFVARSTASQVSSFQTQSLAEDLKKMKVIVQWQDYVDFQNKQNAVKFTSELS